ACPKVIKEILFRAAERTQTSMTLVANHYIPKPASKLINTVKVDQGFDVADNYIAQQVSDIDLVITADIPLAAEVIAKGAHALNPRGELYNRDNIQQRLSMRNFMEEMRSAGEVTGGPAPLNHSDRHKFANTLDRLLAQNNG
ncbi:MAG: YaiI/YqxD family protein, partial [Gammaproteobacteria bacterium]|nr:YaiI/YqxD family protein [Gammaproteobacteria bacterium]